MIREEVLDGALGYMDDVLSFAIEREDYTQYIQVWNGFQERFRIWDSLQNYPPYPFTQLEECKVALTWEGDLLRAVSFAGRIWN